MARNISCRLPRAAGVLILLLLASCFTSDQPLLGAGDTPLPSSFHALLVNAGGRVQLDAGQPERLDFEQAGLSYRQVGGGAPAVLTVRMWDTATRLYAIQDVQYDKSDTSRIGRILYGLAHIEDGSVTIYAPASEDTNFKADMRTAGFGGRFGDFSFPTRERLYDGLRVLSGHLGNAMVMRLRIYASPAQDAQMQADISAAASAPVASSGVADAGSVASAEQRISRSPAESLAGVLPQTDPNRLTQDPGAGTPNGCDLQAADPSDPNRMAPGAVLQAIVPRLAAQECERAVSSFPHTARFRFQLARAAEAAGDYPTAVEFYRQAAASGYPAAFAGLGAAYGEGHGVARDADVAEAMYRKAIDGGVDARAAMASYVFKSNGFSSPQLMQAVYDGRLSASAMKAQSAYWFSFLELYHNTPDCVRVMSDQTYAKFYMAGQMGTITGMLGALAQAHTSGSGDFGADFQSGWDAGKDFTDGMVARVSAARQDAQLFYDRHGCDSPVAARFFGNIAVAADGI